MSRRIARIVGAVLSPDRSTFHGILIGLVVSLGTVAVSVAPALGQPAPAITWMPPNPGEGELFLVRVAESADSPIVLIAGNAHEEPLHFERYDDGVFESLAAVPLGVRSQVGISLTVIYADGREEVAERTVPVRAGVYRHTQLRVAPRLGSPPDSAQRERRRRETARAAEVGTRAHRTPRMWGSEVVLPRDDRITSRFGQGRVFNGQVSSQHTGMDLDGETGDTIYAAARGVVDLAGQFELAGNNVYLNHGGGLVTAYFHMSEQLVAEGDTVEAGAPIGLIGATGRVTGPHLHWVVRYGHTSVDPGSLLSLSGALAQPDE